MLFDPKDLNPEYTPEEIEKLFFLRKDLSGLDEQQKQALLAKVNSAGLKGIRLDTMQILLCVLHDARQVDQSRFLRSVFLPWHELRQKTKPHFERIAHELVRIKEFEPGSVEEAAHAVNVYRNIVADLFDPYLSLVVASYQFQEGTFTSLVDADLGQGERNKFEYLAARVKRVYQESPTFLSGYDPLVRNAISHAGARGVTYGADRIVFKNIKRGTPAVVESVCWSFDELQLRVIQLLECIQSIEVATEIFGLDCTEVIATDFETSCQFALHALTPERRAEWRERHGQLIAKLRESQNVSLEQRREALSRALFYNLGLRGMACRRLAFSKQDAGLLVEVPAADIDLGNDGEVVGRAVWLARYAIVARAVFGGLHDPIHVVETDEARTKRQIAVQCSGRDLDAYAEEQAGLVDLLHDSKWTLEGQPLGMVVDFKAVEQAELASPNSPFPRKARP